MDSTVQDLGTVAAIADDLPLGIWVARAPDGQLVYANRAFREIMAMPERADVAAGGYSEAYGIYRRDGARYPESELPFARALAASGAVLVDDIVIHRGDGTRVNIRAVAKAVRDADGTPRRVVVVFDDISRERAAEEARQEAEERLRRVVDWAPVILYAFDMEGRVTLSEGRGLSSLGFKPGELVGRSVFDVYADMPHVVDLTRRSIEGHAGHARVRIGSTVLDNNLAPILDEHGRQAGVVGVSVDVTEEDSMRRRLVQADRMAAVGTIAAGVAHEINNPLTYVLGSLDLAERQLDALGPAGKAARDYLSQARDGIAHVGRIARDLFTFSRENAERSSPVDVRRSIEAALRMASSQTKVRARVVERFGATPLALADEGRLAQVFLNLLINAAHAIPEGAPEANEITVSTVTDTDGFVVIEFADTGSGVPVSQLERVFDPFFTTKPSGVGTGLGLSVSKSIVESFGGTLTAYNRPVRGSAFVVRLKPAQSQPLPIDAPPREAAPLGLRRVLIIDDDANLGRVFQAVLARHFDVRICATGREGIELICHAPKFDLVLCDVMLQDVETRDLYEELRRRKPGAETELVFITGGTYSRASRAFIGSVPNACYEKPFDIEELVNHLLSGALPKSRAAPG